MLKQIIFIVMIGITFGTTIGMADESEKGEAVIVSAKEWVKIVDKGQYIESWQEASDYFKQAINSDKWKQAIQSVRNPLGKLVSRKVRSATYSKSLPGAPDGQYFIIEFLSSFENKISGIETVTLKMDKDGIWRVSGYFIK